MAARKLPGSPSEEMFFDPLRTTSSATSSSAAQAVEPLRIYKRDGVTPEPRTGSAGSNRTGSAPARRFSPPPIGRLPYPTDDQPAPRKKSSLPYPDDNLGSGSQSSSPGVPEYPRPQPQSSKPNERRGTGPKPLPDSPGPETPDKEGLFQKPPRRFDPPPSLAAPSKPPQAQQAPTSYQYKKTYFPPPQEPSSSSNLTAPTTINRYGSTASVATTKAQRGSPPPPETPILPPDQLPGGGIEARFAAAQRANQNRTNQATASQSDPPRRPWTPTEAPGSAPHGPPTVYQGSGQVSPPIHQPVATTGATSPTRASAGQAQLAQDIQRLHVSGSPPPAYSTVSKPTGSATTAQGYPNEKSSSRPSAAAAATTAAGVSAGIAGAAVASAASTTPTSAHDPRNQGHPAFANDNYAESVGSQHGSQNSLGISHIDPHAAIANHGPASPPPLPEGWIAHLDPASGQYYYIHLQTQSTQWEFPKGPTPLNLNEPTSPVGSSFSALHSPGLSTFGGKPLASPGLVPMSPGYAESVASFASTATTVTGFTGPPPSSGVDMYKVAPTNGVYFGPYLRYTNTDLERGIWVGSIMLVTDTPQPPTIHIHQSTDLSPNPRQLKANPIWKHQRWTFYRYDIDLEMDQHGASKWTYAITSHLGCTRYEFLVAGRYDTNWRFVAMSGNDFDLNVSQNERSRLGGIGFMWKDIMTKHAECGGFHALLGLGDQIYADRIWREIPALKQWLAIKGKENRKNESWTASMEESISHAYFHFYTSHFDQPYLREAFAQIPYVLQLDDHDIFDGFGSYPDYMQLSQVFKNVGRIAIDTYLLFQHHTTLEILRDVSGDFDIFTCTGTGWHFIKYLGPAVAVVGMDCRSERDPTHVVEGKTYQLLFPKIALLPRSVQHCIWMISLPLIYPRLEAVEQITHAVATGKKAVTGAYNLVGRVTSSVAGVVGAKDVVGSGFESIKKAVGKSGLMGGMLSPFGDVAMMDEFRDSWTHESKDLERTYLIRTLQGISHNRSIRMTFLSGGTDCCGAGLVHDPSKPSDHKTMYQLISSSVVNTPPSNYIIKMLHNNKQLYVPANAARTTNLPSDTKEDMMEIFQTEPDGRPREYKKLMGRRNYVAIVAYDPEVVQGTYGKTDMARGTGKLSLAADFMCQSDGAHSGVVKYGPVIIPNLEYGR